MTDAQLNLLGAPAVAVKLTDRQRKVLLALRQVGGTMNVDEAGAILHELKTGRWAHSRDARCDYCGQDGRSVLEALVHKGLAERKRPDGHIVYRATVTDPDPVASDPAFAALTADRASRPVSAGGHGHLPEGF
jgi:hypothetical protein